MSIKIKLALAVLALGVASSLGSGQAVAGGSKCNGAVEHLRGGGIVQCYYLPTVSDGRVTGLQMHLNFALPGDKPRGGTIVGSPCRYAPVVTGGKVTGSRRVCG